MEEKPRGPWILTFPLSEEPFPSSPGFGGEWSLCPNPYRVPVRTGVHVTTYRGPVTVRKVG